MKLPSDPSGSNLQRWALIRLVKYPDKDHLGNIRDTTLYPNLRWLILQDWKDAIHADGGAFAWGEIYKGWGLCIVEASAATLSAISNDARTMIKIFPQKNLTDNLSAGQISTLSGWLLNMGFSQGEIDGLNLPARTLSQILSSINKGVCGLHFDGANIIEDFVKPHKIARSVDDIVNEFNIIKENPFIDPSPNYGIVDSMTRANEDPINYSNRWGTLAGGGRHVAIISNSMLNSTSYAAGLSGGDAFIGAKYGGDVQLAFTAQSLQQSNNNWQLDLFIKSDNANPQSGYFLRFKFWSGGLYACEWHRLDSGADTNIGTNATTVSFSTGQELFISALNDASGTLNCYANGILVNSTTDSTYKSVVGYVGVDMVKFDATTPAWNNMKVGGTITEVGFATFSDDATVGTLSWTSPSQAQLSDDIYATASMAASAASTHYLKATNHGATNYPTGTSFQGFTVKHESKASDNTQDRVNNCKLVIGGSISGTNHSDSTLMATTDAVYSLGGDSDLWSTNPTAAQVNASDFGVVLGFNGVDTANTLSVDQIILRISSTLPSGENILRDISHQPQMISVMAQ